jgi:diacylglycerol kinase family enzyme
MAKSSDETARRRTRACLITNPRSGHGGIDLMEILPVLDAQGWDVTVRAKQYGGHATELAQQAAAEGFNVVVDCDGDGTLSEIVGGVVGTDVAVGTLPGGTVNLWSKEVGISKRLRVAAMQLASAERHRLDVGQLHQWQT